MERSAQGVSRSAEKLARFVVRGNECPTSYEPRPRLFFSPTLFPTLFRTIDRSIDPRREIVCRTGTASLCRYSWAKRKAPNQHQPETGSTSVVWIRMRSKCDDASFTIKSYAWHFSGYERECFPWDEPGWAGLRGVGWLFAVTFGDFDEFRLGKRSNFGILQELDDIVSNRRIESL